MPGRAIARVLARAARHGYPHPAGELPRRGSRPPQTRGFARRDGAHVELVPEISGCHADPLIPQNAPGGPRLARRAVDKEHDAYKSMDFAASWSHAETTPSPITESRRYL